MVEKNAVQFKEYHVPVLDAGDYTISVTQTVDGTQAGDGKAFHYSAPASLKFSVLGPRFILDPQSIQAVFPPEGSLGDHSNVLPHVILDRSTLPWERKPDMAAKGTPAPWLALLLFDESESQNVTVQTLSLLALKASPAPCGPYLADEAGDHPDDLVTVIDVDADLLLGMLPSAKELCLLAHVRTTTDATGNQEGDEVAVVVGNRMPKAGSISTAHLVSLEGRYSGESFRVDNLAKKVCLVSLKSWRFACTDAKQSFKGLLMDLDRGDAEHRGVLRLPAIKGSSDVVDAAERYLGAGCVALPHAMRQGSSSVSWYHGPLVPGNVQAPDKIQLPIRAADDLVRFNKDYGMFDVSYAAAWELGRLLSLQSKSFSVGLYRWKRAHAQKAGQDRLIVDAEQQIAHLPFDGPRPDLDLPETVSSWLEHLALLEGVPFNYLVPDEHMLPPESIRFFQVDQAWMECLLDGAFSIGRVLEGDHGRDSTHRDQNSEAGFPRQVSGFLLRSDVVAGWPGLLVDGYDSVIKGTDAVPQAVVVDSNQKEELLDDTKAAAHRQWAIMKDGAKQYDLVKRENNMIDVRSAAKGTVFSIDAGYATDLIAKTVSAELRKAFEDQKEALPPGISIKPTAWLAADETRKLYLVQEEAGERKIYHAPLPLLRMARLSPSILICLFEGILQTVDIHLRPETLHFGFDTPDDEAKQYHKKKDGTPVAVAWREPLKGSNSLPGVIAVDKLAAALGAAEDAAEFARQMIEGVEKVRFSAQG